MSSEDTEDKKLFPIQIYLSDEESLAEKPTNKPSGRRGRGRRSGRGERGSLSLRGARSLSDVRRPQSNDDDNDDDDNERQNSGRLRNRGRGGNRGSQNETRGQSSHGRGHRGRGRGRGDRRGAGAEFGDREHTAERKLDRGENRRQNVDNDQKGDDREPRNKRIGGNERSRGRGQRSGM